MSGVSKKSQKKKQDKVIEDRTFGLKNKNKSKQVQKFIKGVETTVKHQGVPMSKLQSEQFQKRKQRRLLQEEQAILNSLYNDVNKLKEEDEEDEEDPANIVCPYFKQGLCTKGKKCIYSHDLTLDRTEEIDLYVDQRTQLIMNKIGGKQLSQLSEQQLSKMISDKQRQFIKGNQSNIVCRNFVDAVEKDKYGWNWSCPTGGDKCKYKHCLPPGYKLKRDGGTGESQVDQNIQQKIDEERNKLLAQNLSSALVTYEVFLKWKEDRRKRKQIDHKKKKDEQQKKTKTKGQLKTGKELFNYDPSLFVDDEEAAAEYEQQEQIIEEEQQEEKRERNEGDEEEDQDLQKQEKTEEEGPKMQEA